ncbi:MAG: hypothetical protein FWD12_06645, partial [Alphaproteobacteria bacterium]|nr:hypothetical protein [Alphaproteobacteria bacterium]
FAATLLQPLSHLAAEPARKQPPATRPNVAAPKPEPEPGQPPHAWLFGTWTGGMFPAPSNLAAEACLSQPAVIFTRDLVIRATITDQFYIQRLVETALTTANGVQFRFTAAGPATAGGFLGDNASGTPAEIGFGCANPDVLDVEQRSRNQIVFPNCSDFPYPLVRCPAG